VAFGPDGSLVAFALSNEIVCLLDPRTFETRAVLEPPEPQALFELVFSSDGSTLGTACSTNRVQLWDLAGLFRKLESMGLASGR